MFSSNLKVSNILWLKYTLSDTPFRFTLKFYFILQISFWVHCFPELYFMRAKRVSAVIEAALDDITSCKTSYSVLSHSHVLWCEYWVILCFLGGQGAGWYGGYCKKDTLLMFYPEWLASLFKLLVSIKFILGDYLLILVTNHSVLKAFDITRRNLMVITLNGC